MLHYVRVGFWFVLSVVFLAMETANELVFFMVQPLNNSTCLSPNFTSYPKVPWSEHRIRAMVIPPFSGILILAGTSYFSLKHDYRGKIALTFAHMTSICIS